MTSIKTLPLVEGAKLIVLDEGVDAMYARKLIAGWIEMWKEKDSNCTFELLLFSDPKSVYQNEPEPFMSNNINICDYYTVNVNEIDINVLNKKDIHSLEHILKNTNMKSIIIIDCLTSLILYVGLSKALWFLEKLNKQTSQLICIYRRDFVYDKVPCIETLGTTYVKIIKSYKAQTNNNFNYITEYIHRKLGGGILKQQELVIQNNMTYEIQSEKLKIQSKKLDLIHDGQKQKVESSFRIEINENEMKQREETVLPYTLNTNVINTSKIHYQPEDVDDFDEEDPDDDLCF
ncbi:elongator complex protein 5 [Megachile rotundata]|uniref:elongator complex protein 5 n=1 Tax=Megachile rotundata TaxID=143995 RepID=UPI003FD3BD80